MYTPKKTPFDKGGRATYGGTIVFTNLSRKLVEKVLPTDDSLMLATNTVAPDMHPVIYLYGNLENTRWEIDGKVILEGADYHEMMLLVPFVRKRDGTLWHTYVVRMYLDDQIAIDIGNTHYAYAKVWGDLRRLFAHVNVSDSAGTPKFHAYIPSPASWLPSAKAETDLPNYRAIQTILTMPIIGWDGPGKLLCSYFELSYEKALVAASSSTHEFLSPFVPGMADWVRLGSLSSVVDGAFKVRVVDWRLEHPRPECRF